MTAYHHYDLMCDHPGCDARYRGGPNASKSRDEAAQAGWRHWIVIRGQGPSQSGDTCPGHVIDLPENAIITPVAILRSA